MTEAERPVATAEGETPAPRMTNAVRWLIALNIAVYFVQFTVFSPEDIQLALGFQAKDLGREWWALLTYPFVHQGFLQGFLQLALTVYALAQFGPRLEWHWGAGEFARFYVFCGLGGWIAHVAFVPGDTALVGGTAAALGVLLAHASRWPDAPAALFGVVPMTTRWLAVLLGSASLTAGISAGGENGVAYFAHLGGLGAGWLYLRMAAAVNLTRFKEAVSPVPDEPDEDAPPRAIPRSLPRQRNREKTDDIVARSNAAVAEHASKHEPASEGRHPDPKELDRLLDKISAQGIESLTDGERRLLDDASKRLRGP